MARSQESLWLWAGGTCITAGTALAGVAATLYAARTHYPLWSSDPMVGAYAAFSLALLCFAGAIRGWPFPWVRASSRGDNGRIEILGRADSDTGNATVSPMVRGRTDVVIRGHADLRGATLNIAGAAVTQHWADDQRRSPSDDSALKASRQQPMIPIALGSLPQDVTQFVGRARELAALHQLVESSRLTTVVGIGGGGKTRLAVQLARLKEPEYADGVHFVQLDHVIDPALTASEMVMAIGLTEQGGKTAQQTLIDALLTRQSLLVLDTCERVIESCAQLASQLILHCPSLTILCTSRQPLNAPGELVWRIPPMSLPATDVLRSAADLHDQTDDVVAEADAITLFRQCAAARDPTFQITGPNARIVGDLCRQLDGIPLAIELAASLISSLELSEIATLLDDRQTILASASDVVDRHRTLEAAFDWSYELLNDDQRILFRRLSVFAGGATLESARLVCSDELLPVEAIPLTTSSLVDRSLLEFKRVLPHARYDMLRPVRDYAGMKLMTSDDADSVARRHTNSILRLVDRSAERLLGSEQASALGDLDSELNNIRLALERSASADATRLISLQIAYGMTKYWEIRGYMSEGRRWFSRILGTDTEFPHPDRAKSLLSAGTLAYRQSDYDASSTSYSSALQLGEELSDASVIGHALSGLGLLQYRQGLMSSAQQYFERSLDKARQAGDAECVAWAMQNLGRVKEQEGDLDAAERLQRESLAIRSQVGEPFAIARSLNEVGIILRQKGELDEAEALHRRSLDIRHEIGDRQGEAISMRDLARVLETKDVAGASHWLQESMRIELDVGDLRGVAVCFERLAHICSISGYDADAIRMLGGAAEIRRANRSVRDAADSRMCDEVMASAQTKLGSDSVEGILGEARSMPIRNLIEMALNY
jgi:predicted ATPase